MKIKIKFFMLLILLIITILICKFLLKTDFISYKVYYEDNEFVVTETLDKKNTYIEIKTKNNIFPLNVYNSKNKKIITDIYYYKDKNYECVLPLVENNIYVDMMCYNNDIIYNYSSILEKNSNLDEYVKSIIEYDYNIFLNKSKILNKINTINIYSNNINKNISITTYRGLINNSDIINIFDKDIYNNKLSTYIDSYYLIADYNKEYSFNYFYLVDLNTNKITKIKSNEEISLDSYIQGIVDNKVYIYDKDNENQYEIDIISKTIKIVSNDKKVRYYKNHKWEKINKVTANKEIPFDYDSLNNYFSDFDKVEETTNKYYLIKNKGANYDLYEINKKNINLMKYILTVPTTSINFKDEYLYYSYKSKVYYYSDVSGLKTVLEDSELSFNNTIKYYIY